MKRSTIKLLIASFALILVVMGCSDNFTSVQNPNASTPDNLLTSVDNYNSYLTGIFSRVRSYDLFARDYPGIILDGLGLEVGQSWTGFKRWNNIFQHNVTSTNSRVGKTWSRFYKVILECNDILDQGPKFMEKQSLSGDEKKQMQQILAQAHFFRAFSYFHLIRLFGVKPIAEDSSAMGVPLILKVAKNRQAMQVSRNTVGEVYAQIMKDLKAAKKDLPPTWSGSDKGRPSKWAAIGFIGKVQLYEGKWAEAETNLRDVVENGPYVLADSTVYYHDMFHEAGDFASGNIFEMAYTQSSERNYYSGSAGQQLSLIDAPRRFGFSNFFVNEVNIKRFGNDPRLHNTALEPGVDTFTIADTTVTAIDHDADLPGDQWEIRKYVMLKGNIFKNNNGSSINIIIMRLADVKLMLAEALNNQGKDAQALRQVNQVRRRAYGKSVNATAPDVDYMGLSGTALRDTIRSERFKELLLEGHRWFDMRRWGIIEQELAKYTRVKSGPVSYDGDKDTYLPIPQAELDANPAIKQSPGY